MPSAEIPGFLMDFMKHRQHLTKQDMTAPAVKKSKALQNQGKKDDLMMAIDGIIEKKPGRKYVKEFLQNRVDELSKEKMK